MQIVRDLAGFSYGRSDLVRRAMSKKKDYIMQEERKNFIFGNEELGIEGCLKKGISEKAANQIYDSMIDFAKYAFNKAHAAAYTVVSYRTAYLVCHYPVEFMCAYLTSYIESDKLGSYCNSVRTEKGIEILPPDYNDSGIVFNVVDGKIRFGLSALKGVGKAIISEVIAEREANGKYSSFYDFSKRMSTSVKKYNKKAYEAMILSGSFDSTGYNRRTLMENYERIKSQADEDSKTQASGQLSLFDLMSDEDKKFTEPVVNILEEYDEELKLKNERTVTNLFISGHPLNKYTKAMSTANVASISDIVASFSEEEGVEAEVVYRNNEYVTVACVLFDITKRLTKKGTAMATFKMQDIGGNISAVAFSKCVEESGFLLEDGKSVLVKGKIDVRDDESVQIIVNNVYAMPNNDASDTEFANFSKLIGSKKVIPQTKVQPQQQIVKPQTAHEKYGRGLYLRINNNSNLEQIVELVRSIPGTLPVYIYCVEDNKIYRNNNMKINIDESSTVREITELVGPGNMKLYQK